MVEDPLLQQVLNAVYHGCGNRMGKGGTSGALAGRGTGGQHAG